MAVTGTTKTWTIEYEGLRLEVVATENGDGTSSFAITSLEGSADINALFWNDGVDDGEYIAFDGTKENSLNMNGTGEDWDGDEKLSDTGLGPEGTDKATYLTAGETYYVDSVDVMFDDLATIGIRATSTSTAEGSIKGVDSDPVVVEPPNHFPEWFGPDSGLPMIEEVRLHWRDGNDVNSDGWFTATFDYGSGLGDPTFHESYSNDLDGDLGKLLDFLVNDGQITETDRTELVGVTISGDSTEIWYDLDNDTFDVDTPPADLPGSPSPGSAVPDQTYSWDGDWVNDLAPL